MKTENIKNKFTKIKKDKSKYYLRKILTIIISFFLLFLFQINLDACEIHFSIIKGEKEKYTKGDELIVKITVLLTHRNCPEGIKSTKFETKGLEITETTKWKEENSTTYIRKLKLKITAEKGTEIILNAVRKCEKEGGFGSLILYKP
ncbi:MAG: hypothetical protein V1779_16285 [bacterium]